MGGRLLPTSLAVACGATAAAALLGGPVMAVGTGAAAFLLVAWRHDTATGALLPLAVLVLLTLGVMVALVGLLALFARR